MTTNIQVIDAVVRNVFNNFIDVISDKFNLEKDKLIELLNSPPKADENQKCCPYVATTGKNIGKICGRKCKKDFCYSHLPEVLEKKKLEREAKKAVGGDQIESITIEGNDLDDIVNNIFLEWSDNDTEKSVEGRINRNILSAIIHKNVAEHTATDEEDFEKDGYPATIRIAKTKLRIEYEDGNGLQKSLIPKKSCLTEDQQQAIYNYINSLTVETEK